MKQDWNMVFDQSLGEQDYSCLLKELNGKFPKIPFQVAKSPIFIPHQFERELLKAASEVLNVIKQPSFKSFTHASVPSKWDVPNENSHPHFLCLDFGICEDIQGNLIPQLIELQGFPSLFGFQNHLINSYSKFYKRAANCSVLGMATTEAAYLEKLRKVIIGDFQPKQVVMLDYNPFGQKTAIDFHLTEQYLGLKVLGLDELYAQDLDLYYLDNNEKIFIKRIYNRLIFDELEQLGWNNFNQFDPRLPYHVEWVAHPNWFYRVSKYTLPFLDSKYVPRTYFLKDMDVVPENLSDFVLKPLFSFAGTGVNINPSHADLLKISDPENYILQQKVNYHAFLAVPGLEIKAELRLMYLWQEDQDPELVMNLARLNTGNQIGVRFSDDSAYLGGTVAFVCD